MHIWKIFVLGLLAFTLSACGDQSTSPDKLIKKEILTTTAEQREMIEKSWGGALSAHQEKIEQAFNKFKPNNYQGFAQYKVKDWLPKLNHNQSIMNSAWEKFGYPITSEYESMRKIVASMTDLNLTSIKMQSYLKNHKKADLELINKNLFEISKVSSQYVEYQPKPDK